MGDVEIIFKRTHPFLIPYIIVDIIRIIWAIGMETTLSILGLFNLEIPTIGTTLYWANYYNAMYRGIWWWWGFPVIVMIVTIFGLYLLSVKFTTIWILLLEFSELKFCERVKNMDSVISVKNLKSYYVSSIFGKKITVKAVNDVII